MRTILKILFPVILIAGIQGNALYVSAQNVNFTYSGVCVNSPTNFTVDPLSINIADVINWSWDFGDGNFSNIQNPSNTYLGASTYAVKLVVTFTSLAKDSVTKFVTIQPLPIANFAYNTPNCQNQPVQFTDLSSTVYGYITTWIWYYGDGSPNDTIYFNNSPNVTHVFPNFGTFNVTLKVINSYNCEGTTIIPVTVTPSPIANFYFNGACEDQMVTFTDASFANGPGNIVFWNWDFGDPTSGINNTSNLTDPTHIFSNAGTYTVSLIITNFNNCTDTMTKLVTIYPHPPVDFTYGVTCLNELVYFDPDTTVTNINAIATWNWSFGDGLTSNARNTAHAYIAPGTYTVTLTVTDTSGCENTVSHDITINPLPFAHFDAGTTNCAGAQVTFNELSSTVVGYVVRWIWDFGDGNTQTVVFPGNPNVTHTYANAGTYNVSLTVVASDSCQDNETQAIVIFPNPVANFTFSTSCLGTPVNFSDLTQNNGGGSLVQWQWNFGDPLSGVNNFSAIANPSHVFTSAGTYTVTLIVTTANGCSDTASLAVVVNPKPAVDFNTSTNCEDNAVQFDPNTAVMNPGAIATWSWQFGDGGVSPLQNPTHIYTTPGLYNVTLTVVDTAGCTNTITKPITIIPKPTANFTYSQPACKDAEVQFTDLSSAYVGYIVKWAWNFGDGNNQTINWPANPNVSHIYANYGSFSVTLTITTNDSCYQSFTGTVVVSPNPLANFTFQTSCVNSPVQFTDLSQTGGGGMADWLWNFGDAASGANNTSTLEDPEHTYIAAGTYTVTLIVTNNGGCKDTIQKQVLVHGLPTVDFSSTAGCVNDSTAFVSSTFVNSAIVTQRTWDFGDGIFSNDEDPFHIYTAAGTYQVILTITDTAGCENTATHFVTITPPPNAFFQSSSPACSGLAVSFNDMSTLSSGTFSSWVWDFGDGTVTTINPPASPDVTHIYTNAGTFQVKLKVNTSVGCEAEYQANVTVSASPLAQFGFSNTCENIATQFTDLSTVNGGTSVVSWSWDFGDPVSGVNNTSALQNPLHIYTTSGNYNVNLLITNANGCYDTIQQQVTISPKPGVDFTWSGTCFGTTTQFTTNTTITNVGAVQVYDWDFGDGTPHVNMQNPLHNYTTIGTYSVVLSITDTAGCINSKSYNVTIQPQPTAMFNYTPACQGASTSFTDLSFTTNGEPILTWHWDFGEAGLTNDTSNVANPVWTYSALGTYNVSLIVTSMSGCQDTAVMGVQVYARPTANYTYLAEPCNNGAVVFSDSSYAQMSNISSWLWEFLPFTYSSLQNPVFTFYYSDSCYNVKLIVTDTRGCTDTVTKSVCVPAPFDFAFTSTPTCLRDTTFFSPQLLAPDNDSLLFFSWNFGDPTSGFYNTSALRNPYHYYSVPGTYTVSLQAIDQFNCSSTRFATVVVHPLPIPAFTYTNGQCDSTIQFTQSSSGNGSPISSWIYVYGDGTRDTINAPANPNISHKYLIPGVYPVSLIVTNNNGCSETVSDSVLVRPCLLAEFENIDTLICQNYNLSFADSSYSGLPITNWYWDFGDGNNTTYNSYTNPVTHAFTQSGLYTVMMRITTQVSGRSVSDSTTINVFVNPTPIADFKFNVVCDKSPAVFTNQSLANSSLIAGYNWEFNDPLSTTDTSTLKNPDFVYGAPGTYTVQMIVTSTLGCQDTLQQDVTVHALPDAGFTNSLSCAGAPTLFTDITDSIGAPLQSWSWSFMGASGLLGTSEDQNPEFTFNAPGDHSVNLMVADTNGCADTITQVVTTYNVPVSLFTIDENFDDIQGQVQFTDGSIDAVKYYWDFGNGETSYAQNPVVFYQDDGTYDIMLITWNDKECTDTLKMKYEFLVKGLYIPNAMSPNNPRQEVRFFKPVGINLKDYKIEVYDRWGNLLWYSNKLDDLGRPEEGWNGKFNGVIVPQGVYVWKASAVFKDGTIWDARNIGKHDNLPKEVYGTVTVIE